MENTKTLAEKLHDLHFIQMEVEQVISDAFEKHEPKIYETLDFSIGSDYYDNSIEIYFKISLPYPYEPCKEIRKAIYGLGFSNIYWNFQEDKFEDTYDEVRNYEPRHYRNSATWKSCKYGFVDSRFDEEKWNMKHNFK